MLEKLIIKVSESEGLSNEMKIGLGMLLTAILVPVNAFYMFYSLAISAVRNRN